MRTWWIMALTDFAAFILTHGRPDNVKTYKTLRSHGYTGRIVIVVDDTDKTIDEYRRQYGDQVVVFDKKKIAKTFDTADNFSDMRTIVYARNACFQIAEDLGLKYFIELDDDYHYFEYRFDHCGQYKTNGKIKSLDLIFEAMLDFYKTTPAVTLAMAQGGDFIGGRDNINGRKIYLSRKAMNSFVCGVDKPLQFLGRINEDVNTYTSRATTGSLLFTINQVSLCQAQTQQQSGGMTNVYEDSGTYIKSFYTVMYQPSSVRVQAMGDSNMRLHHRVDWKKTTPMILSEDVRKASE